MNERQWELYRLSMVERWAQSPYKRAVMAAIQHKLMVLKQDDKTRERAKRQASAVEAERHALWA
jgi:hypothetical protein